MRLNIDKVTYRRENKDRYCQLIDHYRKEAIANLQSISEDNIVKVFVRKRPMFEREVKNGEFDVVTCKPDGIVIHECRMHPSLKPPLSFIQNVNFAFPPQRVFNQNSTTQELYVESVGPLIDHVVEGKLGTVFCFGQTGSGKTFTISGMIEMLSEDLFHKLPTSTRVVLTCVELVGESVYDLLNEHREIPVRDGGDGEFVLCDNLWVDVRSSSELERYYHLAGSLRESHATKINSNSSRSHYICRVSILDERGREYGRLTLCDLAGSERNIDSNQHDAERLKETAQINTSLMALKEVMRAIVQKKQGNTNIRIPYRSSKLTRILKDGFESDDKPTQTILISTVSPQACDLEHTIGTLKNVCLIGNHPVTVGEKVVYQDVFAPSPYQDDLKPLAKMDAKETLEWISKIKGGILKPKLKKIPGNMDGKTLAKQAEKRLQQILECEASGSHLRAAIVDHTQRCNRQKREHIEKHKVYLHGTNRR